MSVEDRRPAGVPTAVVVLHDTEQMLVVPLAHIAAIEQDDEQDRLTITTTAGTRLTFTAMPDDVLEALARDLAEWHRHLLPQVLEGEVHA